jgi:hypothetical protein
VYFDTDIRAAAALPPAVHRRAAELRIPPAVLEPGNTTEEMVALP